MPCTERTRAILLEHYRKYPELQVADILKFIFQSACGCEHFVSDRKRVLEYIRYEYADMIPREPLIEPLDGNYSRVHLACIGKYFTSEELADMFVRSARPEPEGVEKIKQKLAVARELIGSGEIGLSIEDFDRDAAIWCAGGYCAIHHSDKFRREYLPAYRVIHNDFLGEIKNGH